MAVDSLKKMNVAWVLTLGYVWLGIVRTQDDKDLILPTLSTRIADLHGWVTGANGWPYGSPGAPPSLWLSPRDSHRSTLAAMVATMSTLLVGDRPAANAWVQDLLPFSLNTLSPWSGEEGGYANGTAYGLWEVGTQLSAWYALRWATCGSRQTCIDLARKAWVRNTGRFLAYFVPPTFAANIDVANAGSRDSGTPIGLFGDG